MDTACVTTLIIPKRRAQGPVIDGQELASDSSEGYVGRHVRPVAPAPRRAIADHPRAQGFSILSRLARADDISAAAV